MVNLTDEQQVARLREEILACLAAPLDGSAQVDSAVLGTGRVVQVIVDADCSIDQLASALNLSPAIVQSDPSTHVSLLRSTVIEELAIALENQGVAPVEMEQRCRDIADLLGLTDLLEHDPARLSGGQTRRLALGAVAIASPETFVLCEPLAGLDPASQERTFRLVRSSKNTVVLSHRHDERWGGQTIGEEAALPSLPEAVRSQQRGTIDLRQVRATKNFKVGPVDLQPVRGGVLWLRGDNGSGKTSLLRAIAGLDKHRAAHPSVSLALQSPVDQVAVSSVRKFLGSGGLEAVESGAYPQLGGLLGEHPLDLSGSTLRLAQVLSVCVQGRELVLLDEPDTLLAPSDAAAVHRALAEALGRGAAIIMTCHDPAFMDAIARYAEVDDVLLPAGSSR